MSVLPIGGKRSWHVLTVCNICD